MHRHAQSPYLFLLTCLIPAILCLFVALLSTTDHFGITKGSCTNQREVVREGGQAEFKWADVSADKDREHYLGHSINAPTGRWQKNKDIHWYNREKQTGDERAEELAKIKEAEREAMSVALGFKPSKPAVDGVTSGANAIPVAGAPSTSLTKDDAASSEDEQDRKLTKEEKQLKKIERKLAKAERKRQRREEKEAQAMRHVVRQRERERPMRSRSASPRRGDRSRSHGRDRRRDERDEEDYRRRLSTSPYAERDRPRDRRPRGEYDEVEMEKERAKDRKRWEDNLARQERAKGKWD